MRRAEKITQNFSLSAKAVDEISALTRRVLEKGGSQVNMRTRLRLATEEALLRIMDALGEGCPCRFQAGKRLGRWYIRIFVEGKRVNPFEAENEMDTVFSSGQDYLGYLGIAPSYAYRNGENILLLQFRKTRKHPFRILLITLLSALLTGFLCLLLPQEVRSTLAAQIISPIFSKFMGFLSSLAGPMMFLAVIWGIYGIGDIKSLGTVGRKLFPRLLSVLLIGTLLSAVVAIPSFAVSLRETTLGAGGLAAVFQMVLDIIPENIITPFTEKNTLQLVFLAVIVGLAALLLNQKALVFSQFVEQTNAIVQLIMETVASLVPAVIFLSIVKMILSGSFSELKNASRLVIVFLCTMLLMVAGQVISVCVKYKLSIGKLLKKVGPVFLIALSTASSSAAFAENMNTCEHRLGIDGRIVNFGIPIGTVTFMPAYAVLLFLTATCMAGSYQVVISVPWLLTALLLAVLLSIANPPIPGGGAACYTILFLQLGIPASALPVVFALEALADYLVTAVDVVSLQLQLVSVADDLEMLDKDKLKA